jgi:hypothetical protein
MIRRRRNSRPTLATEFGRTVRRSRRTVAEFRAEDRDTMNAANLARTYARTTGHAMPTLRDQRATQKAINAIFLRRVGDERAFWSAMVTLPDNYGEERLGAWYAFTRWAIKHVGRNL